MKAIDAPPSTHVVLREPEEIAGCIETWEAGLAPSGRRVLSHDSRWLLVLRDGLGHVPYAVEAVRDGRVVGLLPLCYLRSRLFGRFLVGLPYLNYGGVEAEDADVAKMLVDQAVELADRLNVRYLELRHECEVEHVSLPEKRTSKVHMRLALPRHQDELWKGLSPKVRNLIRKGEQNELQITWGNTDLLAEFFAVFSHNMRDLGTPTFGRNLFQNILFYFPNAAELCVVRKGGRPVAAALLLHGRGTTEVPSASSLRAFQATNANMLMYWHLLSRAIERGQTTFDFGRSSAESGTYRFKKQWGAEPHPAVWQYYVRQGSIGDLRPENRKYRLMIRLWQRLPLGVSRWLGPKIVRGIP
ncbi:MAG: FemAB family PEP-CTERM system-associated protein [Planctomycetes bacterium]|nr:FemAB family PEP-CTERM system-associated protein [Planctomycetota bacterium]